MEKPDAAGRITHQRSGRPLDVTKSFIPHQFARRLRDLRNQLEFLNGCKPCANFRSDRLRELSTDGTLPLCLLMLHGKRFSAPGSDALQRAKAIADNFSQENKYNRRADRLRLEHLELLLKKLDIKRSQSPYQKLSYNDLRELNAKVQNEADGKPTA